VAAPTHSTVRTSLPHLRPNQGERGGAARIEVLHHEDDRNRRAGSDLAAFESERSGLIL